MAVIVDTKGYEIGHRIDENWAQGQADNIIYNLSVDKKYELLPDDNKKVSHGSYDMKHKGGWENRDRTVYRIRALRDFGNVKAGDLGGYIESENNLSHTGNCWVYDSATVCNDAVVKEDATVYGEATIEQAAVVCGHADVFGKAWIKDNAKISDHARVGCERNSVSATYGDMGWEDTPDVDHKNADVTIIQGNAKISGHACVIGEVVVEDNATIMDNAVVKGEWPIKKSGFPYYISAVYDNAVISGNTNVTNAYVHGDAVIRDDAVVSGHPTMGGHAEIAGKAQIDGSAKISHNVVVNGEARISGVTEIANKVNIGHDADIQETDDLFNLKAIGKTSMAFRNQDGGITVVHKGKTYNGIEEFKEAMVDSLGDKGRDAIEQMENHFNSQMAKSLEEGLASMQESLQSMEQ